MSLRRRRWFVFGLAVAMVVLGTGFWATRRPEGERPGLQAAIAAEAERLGEGQILVLSQIADYPWDHAYLFEAYSTLQDVREQLGFEWSPMSPLDSLIVGNAFLGYEGRVLMVLVEGERGIAGWAVINELAEEPRVDIRLQAQSESFPRDEAQFRLERTGSGWLLIPTVAPAVSHAGLN